MSRYLVTGASGFVGRNLVAYLQKRGHVVRCLTRKTSNIEGLRGLDVEVVQGDMDQPQSLVPAVQNADVVCHLAAITYALRYDDMLRVNGQGPGHLAAACAALEKPPVLVHVSSIAAGGPAACGKKRSEAEPPAPISIYGRSKLVGEESVLAQATKVPTTIIRPGIVFGPWGKDLLPAFRAIRGLHAHLLPGWRSPPVSMIHVEDLCEIIVRAAEKGRRLGDEGQPTLAGPGVYYAVAPECPTWGQMGRMCAGALRRPWAVVLPPPPPLPFLIAAVSQIWGYLIGRAAEYNLDKWREAVATSWACDGTRVAVELDFTPPKLLQERLDETIDWCFANRWLVQTLPYGKQTPSLVEELVSRLWARERSTGQVSHPSVGS